MLKYQNIVAVFL